MGNHFVRVLTMKEAVAETRPLALDALLKIPANFNVLPDLSNAKTRERLSPSAIRGFARIMKK